MRATHDGRALLSGNRIDNDADGTPGVAETETRDSMSEELTLLEKAALLSGASTWESRDLTHRGIRPLFFADGPHGVRRQVGPSDHLGLNASQPATCFPTAATVACSWDVDLAAQVGTAIGAEAAQQGVDVLLGPGLNIKRSPLGGRNFEYFSEDPLLSGRLAAAYVRGIQSQGIAACPKHFAANSQELRRMASDSVVDERTLREIYLTGFEIAVREGKPRSIMSSYNLINGTYAHENAHLLTDILRDEWGFDGAVVTDWGGGNDAVAAVRAGGTIEMPSPGLCSAKEIVDAVEAGVLDIADVDARVAEMRALVEGISPAALTDDQVDAHHQFARRVAAECAVLLKNEANTLPLNTSAKIAIIGDFASNPRYQGAGSSLVNARSLVTPLEAWKAAVGDLPFAQGFRRDGSADYKLADEAVAVAAAADVVVLYLGLDELAESEGMDRSHLRLASNQIELIDHLRAVCDTIVVVLTAGAVIEMPWIDHVSAVLHGYLGGEAGAEGVVDVLTGVVTPSGRLAETYPLTLEDNPSANYFPSDGQYAEYREGPYVGYRYYSTADVPVRFPFGFGLSYTTFSYADLKVTSKGATFTITNTGDKVGAEVPQLYVTLENEDALRPHLELKGFTKVKLEPGQSTRVTIPFDSYTFRRFDVASGAWVTDGGDFTIRIGASATDEKLVAVHRVKGVAAPNPAPALCAYRKAQIAQIDDATFAELLGRPVPQTIDGRKVLGINDPVSAMHAAKSPLARFAARIMRGLLKRAERRGKPDLNLLFLYGMPFRAIGKMTMGAVSMPMVRGIVDIVNGHFWRGLTTTLRAALNTRSQTKQMKRELAACAQSAANDTARKPS